jgi:hypothetical protein
MEIGNWKIETGNWKMETCEASWWLVSVFTVPCSRPY